MHYDKELGFAKELALEAGQIMRRYFRAEDIGTKYKEDTSPLTVADTQINAMVIGKIQQTFPDDGVIGEEESYKPERDRVWVCDPIDGTAPFSLGMPLSTFLLALVDKKDGQPVVAVCYDPFHDDLYSAVEGQGAYLNEERLTITESAPFPCRYVSVYGAACKKDELEYSPDKLMTALRQKNMRNFVFSSGAYTMVKVAESTFSAVVIGTPALSWDTAAPALIVQEAGGLVTDLEGKKRRFDEPGFGCVFTVNEETHRILLSTIRGIHENSRH